MCGVKPEVFQKLLLIERIGTAGKVVKAKGERLLRLSQILPVIPGEAHTLEQRLFTQIHPGGKAILARTDPRRQGNGAGFVKEERDDHPLFQQSLKSLAPRTAREKIAVEPGIVVNESPIHHQSLAINQRANIFRAYQVVQVGLCLLITDLAAQDSAQERCWHPLIVESLRNNTQRIANRGGN